VPFLVTLDRVDEAAALIAGLGKACHVYTSLAVLSPEGYAATVAAGPAARGGANEMGALVCLWSDLDVKTEGHHKAQGLPLPPTLEAATGILAGLPAPSFTVSTGGGLHAYWLLGEPLIIDTPAARQEAADLAEGWGAMIAHTAATRHGWHVDKVGDLPRVFRVCGTCNPKTEAAPRVTLHDVTEWPAGIADARPWRPGPVYDWRELANIVTTTLPAPPPPRPTPAAPTSTGTTSGRSAGTGDGPGILDAVAVLPWSDVWPPDWSYVGTGTVKGETVELWKYAGATSPYSAKCWPDGGSHVFTEALADLPAGKYGKARIYAWRQGYGHNGLSDLSRAIITAARGTR
jgi:hypothetical protein